MMLKTPPGAYAPQDGTAADLRVGGEFFEGDAVEAAFAEQVQRGVDSLGLSLIFFLVGGCPARFRSVGRAVVIRRIETPPEITRTDVQAVVITVRHTGDDTKQQATATAATTARSEAFWPGGLLSWSLFSSTDGRALLAYEQWEGDDALDAALALPVPYVPGIPGTESSAPVRYRLHRSHLGSTGEVPVGCVVTPVFDVDGPERQRHFIDEVFAMTQDVAPMAGSIAAHFHTSTDGTRVFNYAEWSDEQAHIDAVTADDPQGVRRRITGEIDGVRPCGYRRWHLHTSLVPTGREDVRPGGSAW
ncbi:antibiotic biosynthesis monooxygenase [Streptomyces sp. Inha503]|uniref:antibiotic biosynthesis monooxygenase n=1 Tax=Streptomyces sp. Inha503 TaxID=3383314 RepID=UPI00399F3812